MSRNRILSRLSRQDFALLEPLLEPVDLPVRKTLEARKKRIEHVYFIESGFASVVADGTGRPSIEVGIIGREGMTGLAILLGSDRAQHETYIQAAGSGLRMGAKELRHAIDRSTTLHRAMLLYVHAFLLQTTTTALANGRSKIEERLARWLLMADDRIDGKELPLTPDLHRARTVDGCIFSRRTLSADGLCHPSRTSRGPSAGTLVARWPRARRSSAIRSSTYAWPRPNPANRSSASRPHVPRWP
jgi:CRP-like cAMP-binding protein